ncbi:MAG: fibronectin type III domain-containing protein [Bacteroidetes bacterium]|nr:fibronectin type III domain-containing protein [Bacteroidota bacterium]
MKKLYSVLLVLIALQSMASPPTIPTSNLSFPQVDGGYFNIAWTAGNGAKRIIVCKAGSAVTFLPQNGVDYTANTAFGSGQQVAAGEYVIYNSAFTSFFLTNLSPATQYFFAVFEYNGTGATTEYLLSGFLTDSASTSSAPTLQVSNAVFSAVTTNTATVSWTNGNGQRRLIVVRQGSAVNADPVMSHQYNVNASFGSGEVTGTGNFTVYASSGSSTTITNLVPGTTYFFAFYEYNGSGQPQYLVPSYTSSVTTRSIPTIPSSGIVLTKRDGKELTLSWTNGNGQRRIIIAKKASDITSVPANGTDYTANAVFGSGQQLNAGEFVVYDDNFNSTTVSGLDPASTYFFRIFEYDGTGLNSMYLTSAFATTSEMTAITPTVQASAISASNITANSLDLLFTNGSGRARLIIARKALPVNVSPQDFTTYNASEDFGAGQDLGSGNFVLSVTTGNMVLVHNLEPNSLYHFAVFEFNGFNQPLYLVPGMNFSATTLGTVPVQLLSFTSLQQNSNVLLKWESSGETGVKEYVIERSNDAIHFITISTIKATGSSGTVKHYETTDEHPNNGINFYRLKIVDHDGRFEYGSVRKIVMVTPKMRFVSGNMVSGTISIEVDNDAINKRWEILNSAGQLVKTAVVTGSRITITLTELSDGYYWIRLQNNPRIALPFIKH